MDTDRLLHSLGVARKMVEIAKEKNLTLEQQQELFILGFNHDIGYEFPSDTEQHQTIGGNLLRNEGYKYWQEVYYHGMPDVEYESLYLLILNQADMQVDKYGTDVGYERRLNHIKYRYGDDSTVYMNVKKLIDSIKDK